MGHLRTVGAIDANAELDWRKCGIALNVLLNT